MDFGGALHCMIGGDLVCRAAWARDVVLGLQKPDEHSKMTQAYIYQRQGEYDCVPWVPTHEDMLATDWTVYE